MKSSEWGVDMNTVMFYVAIVAGQVTITGRRWVI